MITINWRAGDEDSAHSVVAAALAGFAAPATADEMDLPLRRLPHPHARAESVARRAGRAPGQPAPARRAVRINSGPGLPRPFAREGWRLVTQVAPVFTSDLGDARDLMAASTGFSPRISVGYEYLFGDGDVGVTPGVALQFARLGMEYQQGSVLYFEVQPKWAAVHPGRFAPYASLGLGVDRFHLAGGIADISMRLAGTPRQTGSASTCSSAPTCS